jgi:hypothetical protein
MKKKRPYCTRLATKKMISSLAFSPSSPYNSVIQGGHVGGEVGPSSLVLARHEGLVAGSKKLAPLDC